MPGAMIAEIRRQAQMRITFKNQGRENELPQIEGKSSENLALDGTISNKNAPLEGAEVATLVSGCLEGKSLNDAALSRWKK